MAEDKNLKIEGLQEIILTRDAGFVIKETQEPIEIICGVNGLGRVSKNTEEEKTKGVIDATIRFYPENYGEKWIEGINGYIIHGSVELGQVTDRIPREKRDVMTLFSAVKYTKKENPKPK